MKPPQIEILQQRIDEVNEQVSRLFGNIDEQKLNWKPTPDSWSIAQVLDHLITINETYFPIFNQLKSGSYKPPFIAKIGILTRFFGKVILKSVQPENPRKVKTFPIWEPDESALPSDIVDQFLIHQEKLKSEILSLEEFIKSGVSITSPANKMIVYKLETAIEIIVSHEERHIQQARNVKILRESETD